MKTVEFGELYTRNFTLSDIIVMPQAWINGKTFIYSSAGKTRPDHGIMLFVSGSVRYTDDNGKLLAEACAGDLVYAPKDSSYRAFFSTDNPELSELDGKIELTNYLVNFNLFDADGEQLALSDVVRAFGAEAMSIPFSELKARFDEILSCFRNAAFPPAKVKAMLYNLLCDVSMSLGAGVVTGAKSSPVKAAVDYIAENYLSAELRVSELARLCCMSEVNFRRVFEKQCGASPKSYILKLKLDCAQMLLKRGDFSVAEVARYTGFEDASYFVRIYKKHRGQSPGSVKKVDES